MVKNLVDMFMDDNILNGPIPSSIGQLTNLKQLYLSSNRLNGPIPLEIGDLTDLSYLDLSNNFLTGRIPWSLDQLTNLYSLNLSANQMDEMIPPNLGGLSILSELALSSNQLSGYILNLQLTNATRHLDLSQNQFTGPLPNRLEQLSNLWYLGLSNNYLNGIIPTGLASLPLDYLNPSHNNVSGEIPIGLTRRHGSVDLTFVTEKSNVYSFGVVALETIMGKHPGELLSSLALLSAQNIMLSDVLDSRLSHPTNPTVVRNIVLAVTLAFTCVHSEPKSRPTMLFISQELLVCKKTLATPFRVISLR
ncbi:hypothetical protein HYC85_029728 [Camellia sinensis]|uniref:Serine-threonine/tyrosine-protein kinase catalytic domain-containing protein n=1 Tax=Camellia sinensis TaxID=4442 RepID=A0A7J7FZF3_CAMSI|nr:hypothetical protein HYC85_029728 [Camellia sinensis]